MNDTELMSRLAQGDAAALDELVGQYWRPLVAYVTDMVGDRDAAYDVAQETFVRLWQRREQWDPRGSVRLWLFRTARNLAISEYRKREVRARSAPAFAGTERQPRTPLQEAEDEELRAAVDTALRQLSPRRREAFTLFYLRDFSYREIADIMGIQQQSVANHLQGALTDLRTALSRFFLAAASQPASASPSDQDRMRQPSNATSRDEDEYDK